MVSRTASILLFVLFMATLSSVCHAADQAETRAAARAIFEEAASSHRAMRASKDRFKVTVFREISGVMPFDESTTGTVARKWRHECQADYASGALISETYRLSEKFDGVEQVDLPRPVLAYQLCRDCEPNSIRQTIPFEDPRWSTVEPMLKDDAVLVDPLDVMDRVEGRSTANFLDKWKEDYIDSGRLIVSVQISPDYTTSEVEFDYLEGQVTYRFAFQHDGADVRFCSFVQQPRAGSMLQHVASMNTEWAEFPTPDGRTLMLPTRSTWTSMEEDGPFILGYSAEDWTVDALSDSTTEYEEYVATRSALITYDGMASRLEVERSKREQVEEAPAP